MVNFNTQPLCVYWSSVILMTAIIKGDPGNNGIPGPKGGPGKHT